MSEKSHKKAGRIAIPFLVTVFISLIIIGGIAFYIYLRIRPGDKKPKEPPTRTPNVVLSPEDNHTVLFIYDDQSSGRASTTFVLMRSVPFEAKKILFVGIPSNSICYSESKKAQISLKDEYEHGGAPAAVEFVNEALSIDFDKYMVLDHDSFKYICDINGSVTIPVDIPLASFEGDGSSESLDSELVIKYLTYNKFNGGEPERAYKAAYVASEIVKGIGGDVLSQNIDTYYASLSSRAKLTNITINDYNKKKSAIKYSFGSISPTSNHTLATWLTLDGTVSGNDFLPSENFVSSSLKDYFNDGDND